MEENNKLSWAVPAYHHDKKTVDWFWGFGVIILSTAVASILLENYYFAVILIVGGGMMAFFAHQEPETFYYELNKDGLKIKDRLYPYKNIQAFWVDAEKTHSLFIRTDRVVFSEIKIKINKNVSTKIREILLKQGIKEEEMKEHFSEVIMDMIGY